MISRKLLSSPLLLVLLAAFAVIPWAAGDETCPRDCQCLSEASAIQSFGVGNYQMCQSAPCGKEQSPTGAVISKYCFKSKCPTGCQCLTEEKAKELGYSPCSGQMISCGRDEMGRTLYCFSPTAKCPTQCRCLSEEEAKEMGYSKLCQDQRIPCGTDALGRPKYCFQVPVTRCPDGCICLSNEDAQAQGLKINCLDSMGKPIICGIINADSGIFKYCFKKPEQIPCRYDYQQGRCVGECSAGKCQLNTIYRDPKTGAVTYAECHCK